MLSFIREFQLLLAFLLGSNRPVIDPSFILNSIIDANGNKFDFDGQRDIIEFNDTILTLLEGGMKILDSKMTKPKKDINILSLFYFGNFEHTLSFTENNIKVDKKNTEQFTMISLNVNHKEIYYAWESTIFNDIEGFQTEKNNFVIVKKSTWIERLPKVLFIHLQRVLYDNAGKSQKNNSPFTFETEIFVDRFLLENKEESLKIFQKVELLRKKEKKLSKEIQDLNSFMGSGSSVLDFLNQTEKFLGEQKSASNNSENKPWIIGVLNPNDFHSAYSSISNYKTIITKKLESIKNDLALIKNEIKSAFSKLRKKKYYLSAIINHKGTASLYFLNQIQAIISLLSKTSLQ